jgi:hypothetical protein
MSATTFVREARELAGWFGPQAAIVLHDCSGVLGGVAGVPDLRWIYSLSLHSGYSDDDVEALCKSPHLGAIRELALGGVRHIRPGEPQVSVTARACVAIAEAQSLTGLHALSLARNPVADEGASAVAGAERLTTLRVLHLEDTGLTGRGIEALIRSPYLNSLEQLTLSPTGLRTRHRARLIERFGAAVRINESPPVRRR